MRYLLGAGLSPYGAAGLVSRWANVEASGGPASVNPYSGAFGIAQWLGSRLPAIRGNTNFDAQLQYAVRELNSSEARAGSVLRSASSPWEGALGASMFERAEGYNANTGVDNFTSRTASGIPSIVALLGAPAQAQPPMVATSVSLNPVIPNASAFDFGFDETDPDSVAGIVKTASVTGIVLALAATFLMVYLIRD